MSDRNSPAGTGTEQPSKRLESWKEIASYLERAPRTVRRWERREGLPVHRHQHAKGSTVFAFSGELDEWLAGRVARSHAVEIPQPSSSGLPSGTAEEALPPVGERIRPPSVSWILAGCCFLAVAMAGTALWLSWSSSDPIDPMGPWIQNVPVEHRLLLEASYLESRGEHEKALEALEGAASIGAIGRQAVEMALRACQRLGEPSRCGRLTRLAADHQPGDAVLQALAAEELSRESDTLALSLEYAHRAAALAMEEPSALNPGRLAFVELLPARTAWLEGDVGTSAAELDRLEDRAAVLGEAHRNGLARAAGKHCLALGRIECARSWFAQISMESERHELESQALFAAGRMEELAGHLAIEMDYRSPETVILLAMSGMGPRASHLLDRLGAGGLDAGVLDVARGGLDFVAGRTMEARRDLAIGVEKLRPPGVGMHFIGLDMLSRIAETNGDLDRAAELLEATSEQRRRAALLGSGLFWIECQTRLAEVYRSMERPEDALRVERELLTALALSDPGHPVAAALKRRSA